jgi:hypothetical protein
LKGVTGYIKKKATPGIANTAIKICLVIILVSISRKFVKYNTKIRKAYEERLYTSEFAIPSIVIVISIISELQVFCTIGSILSDIVIAIAPHPFNNRYPQAHHTHTVLGFA